MFEHQRAGLLAWLYAGFLVSPPAFGPVLPALKACDGLFGVKLEADDFVAHREGLVLKQRTAGQMACAVRQVEGVKNALG